MADYQLNKSAILFGRFYQILRNHQKFEKQVINLYITFFGEKYFRLPIKNSITSSRKSEGANGISLPTFPFDLRFNYRESRRKIAPFCEKIQNTFPLSSCKSRRHFSLKSDLYFSMRFFFRIKSLVLLYIYIQYISLECCVLFFYQYRLLPPEYHLHLPEYNQAIFSTRLLKNIS